MITKDSETPDDIGIPAVVVDDISDLVCGYHLALIKPKRELVDPVFLSKQLAAASDYFAQYAAGSTRYGLSNGAIANTPIPLAPLRHQQRVAAILTSLDTAIEKTEALIEKHQQIKAGLMHDLFTCGVLPNGQLRPSREQAPGLYRQTPIDWLPINWRASTCGETCSIDSGITLGPHRRPRRRAHPYLRVANVFRDEIRLHDVAMLEALPSEAESVLKKFDLLVVEGHANTAQMNLFGVRAVGLDFTSSHVRTDENQFGAAQQFFWARCNHIAEAATVEGFLRHRHEVIVRHRPNQRFLECGGKPSATPLSETRVGLNRNDAVENGERMRPACCGRRRAAGFVLTNLPTVWRRTTVGGKFAARRRKPHARGVCSPFSTPSCRMKQAIRTGARKRRCRCALPAQSKSRAPPNDSDFQQGKKSRLLFILVKGFHLIASRTRRQRKALYSWRRTSTSYSDWMPGRFEFHCVENPIRIFRFAREPLSRNERVRRVSLEIDRAARPERRAAIGQSGAIDNCIHIHVTGDMRNQFGAPARDHVHHPAGQIARRQNLGKGQGRQGKFLGWDHDHRISGQNDRRHQRDQ